MYKERDVLRCFWRVSYFVRRSICRLYYGRRTRWFFTLNVFNFFSSAANLIIIGGQYLVKRVKIRTFA